MQRKKSSHSGLKSRVDKILWSFGVSMEGEYILELFSVVCPQYKIEKLTSPNLTFPFDYILLPVDEEFKVCPTTFIVKILKSRGTSVY